MRHSIIVTLAAATLLAAPAQAQKKNAAAGYPITPVPFTQVKVPAQSFWGQRLEASRKITIPLAFSKCESEGRYKNFERAAQNMKTHADNVDVNKVMPYSFDDTDPYKTIEGASYILQTFPDNKLKGYIDSVLNIIAPAQEPDGYLYTARTQNYTHPHSWAGKTRWSKVEDLSHELYNLGHMVEGAVAHWQATGSRKFLDIACRYADCVVKEVGPGKGQACVVPGHQIAEMALCRLYLATGNKKYLDEAKFFLDYRGKTSIKQEYSQSHKPVVEQDEAVGHAVRAAYMYAGMADVAALTGDSAYIHAIDRIWDNIVTKKLYITGGIGATASGEAFGPNYYLPNMSAYCETCAAIGNVYVNYRLFLLHGESKYYDVLERSLYNGLISGVSLDGGGFFYPNPLESMGQHQRQPWFGCACCPSNICRFIPSLPGYVYAVKDNNLYVNLFLANTATMKVGGKSVTVSQQTAYPYNGDITVSVVKGGGAFGMKIRVPGWLKNQPVPSNLYSYSDTKRLGYKVLVNGKAVEGKVTADGYYTISRKWKKGDKVQVHFDIKEVLVNQNPSFKLGTKTLDAFIPEASKAKLVDWRGQTLTTLTTDAQTLAFDKAGKLTTKDVTLTLIPYYAWAHRGGGDMKVWLAQDLKATNPSQPATLASQSKIESSMRLPSLQSINDRLVPKDATDRSIPYTHWWPKNNTTEWISYTFPEAATVQSSTVYWFDDQPWGGCSVPDSWKLYYKDAQGQWQPVEDADAYPVEKGAACTVNFKPVKTTAMKLEVKINERLSAGVFEWSVK